MKRLGWLALLVTGLAGCETPEYHLAPGDKILFGYPVHAREFREVFRVDTNHTGRVVEINDFYRVTFNPIR